MGANTWGERQSVVVPGVAAPSSVACLRSLARRDVRTIVVSSEETTPGFRSRYCDEAVVVPSPHDDLLAYKDALKSLAMRPDVRTIVPVREPDVYVLSTYRDEFSPHVGTPWPSLETLARVQDRIELVEAAATAGVSAPETVPFTEPPDPDREWIVKPRYSILTSEYVDGYGPETCVAPPSTQYLEPAVAESRAGAPTATETGTVTETETTTTASSTETDVLASTDGSGAGTDVDATAEFGTTRAATTPETARAVMKHVPVRQEYVPTSDEYAFFALYDHGEPVATFQHRQRRGYSYAGGPSSYRESVRIPELEAAGRALLDHLDWHGLAMVEFLRDEETGEFELMEINPRFWSSLPFTVQTGADFPFYYWLLATGQRERIENEYEVGIGGHLLRGELVHLYSVLTDDVPLVEKPAVSDALWDVCRTTIDQPRFDYLRRDDPWPFVRDLANAARGLR